MKRRNSSSRILRRRGTLARETTTTGLLPARRKCTLSSAMPATLLRKQAVGLFMTSQIAKRAGGGLQSLGARFLAVVVPVDLDHGDVAVGVRGEQIAQL